MVHILEAAVLKTATASRHPTTAFPAGRTWMTPSNHPWVPTTAPPRWLQAQPALLLRPSKDDQEAMLSSIYRATPICT